MICDSCRAAADDGGSHAGCPDLQPAPLGSQAFDGNGRLFALTLVPVYRNWCDCQHRRPA